MNLRRVLSLNCVVPRLKATDKAGVMNELLDCLDRSGRIRDRTACFNAVRDREQRMSTGLQNGVAVPHGKTDGVDELVAAFGCQPEGIEFESLDGSPSRIFLMTLSPVSRTGPHIQFLAEMSRLLHSESTRKALLETADADRIASILWGDLKID